MAQKSRRIVFIGLAVLVAGVVLAIGAALAPPVQTWAARRWLSTQPDLNGTIDRVSVGLHQVTVTGVDLRTPQGRIVIPHLEVDVGVIGAARGHPVIARLVAHGWTLDPTDTVKVAAIAPRREPATAGLAWPRFLAQAAGTSPAIQTTAAEEAFTGVLALLRLPVDISVDGVDLAGRIKIPAAEGVGAAGEAEITLQGGGLQAGQSGHFTLSMKSALVDPTAPVQSLNLQGEFTADMATTRTFSGLSCDFTLDARGPQFPQGTTLTARLSAREAENGETYDVAIATVDKELLAVGAAFAPADSKLDGEWRISVSDTDVAPFALGFALPLFTANGKGAFGVTRKGERVAVDGSLRLTADRLGAVSAPLAAWGALTLGAEFAVERRGDLIRISRLETQVNGVEPVFELVGLQTFDLNLATQTLAVADSSRDLLRLTLLGVPLAWAQPWLGDTIVSGTPVTGQWLARAVDGGFVLRGAAPLQLRGVDVSQAGEALLRNLNVSALVSAAYSAQGWQLQLESMGLRGGDTVLATLEAKAAQTSGSSDPIVVIGKYDVNIAGWLGQPIAQGRLALQSGNLGGEFSARVDELTEVMAKGLLRQVVTTDTQTMPAVEFDARIDVEPTGRIKLELPVKVTQEQRVSDLAVRGTITPGDVMQVDLAITGDRVVPEDVQILAAPFAVAEEMPEVPGEDSSLPPWTGVEGTITLALKEVSYREQMKLLNVNGKVVLTATEARLEGFETSLDTGGVFGLQGVLKTTITEGKPGFALDANLKGSEIAAGPMFKAFAPDEPPTIEGTFAVEGKVTGKADALAELADTATGEFSFSSKGGVLRALGFQVSQTAQVGSSVVGLVAGLIGGQKAQNIADIAKAASALSATLSALPFDQFSGKVSRSTSLDYRLSDLALISPTLRLQGAGGISYQPNVSVWRQPLLVELSLSARDATAENLKKLKLLRAETDSLGYSPIVKPIKLDGSLVAVGTSELQSLVAKALTQF